MSDEYNHDYSVVETDVGSNCIFLKDIRDGESLVISPDDWDLIKETVDQKIKNGCLSSF